MRILCLSIVLVVLFMVPALGAEDARPWWKQRKIVFMWGQWNHARIENEKDYWNADLPQELFHNIARAGGTVFAELRGYKPDHARYAHRFGMRYFATLFVNSLPSISGPYRTWVKESGEVHWFKCPLDEVSYTKWLVEPFLDGARDGLIDGISVDWEAYGGHGEAGGLCYCDDCFAGFVERQGIEATTVNKEDRFAWLKGRDMTKTYEDTASDRRVEMFTRLRKKLNAANPQLLFSSYGTTFSDFTRAVNTPETPFIFLDSRHYYNDDRQPWWESYGARLRQEGYLYIPGGWTNALFGAQASQVSAARWIYEAALNEDGCWLWFERELDDEILSAYAQADHMLRSVEARVGRFLHDGKRDTQFVTAVEWTGRPELEQAVIAHTYHLGNGHLIHINNVNTEWPVRVRIRLPHLKKHQHWTVGDPMSELYHARGRESGIWTSAELHEGVVVVLAPRSDRFLLIAPSGDDLMIDPAQLVHSREFNVLSDHATASAQAGPVKALVNLYIMKNSVYGERLEALLAAADKLVVLPKGGWQFRWDQDDVGAGERWFLPDAASDAWAPIEIERFWGSQGGMGAGWYRASVDIPAVTSGERVYLHFGAVDEQMVLWIDGQYAGDYDRDPPVGWDKPFAIDVTGLLTGGRHYLAMRVQNAGGAGGIWKPISVLTGPIVEGSADTSVRTSVVDGPAGRLVYTATEPMGFGGAEGGLTIANTIRTVDGNGANHLRLRQLRGHIWSPSYSPDGKQIAFVHDAGGLGQIYVMADDGSNAVNVSDNAFCDRSPVWSPDGNMLTFMSDREGDWDIYVMNADGTSPRCLAANPGLDRAPAWSPNGLTIAWESHVSGTPSVWVCATDTWKSRPLIDPDKPLTIQFGQAGEDKVFNFVDVESMFPDNTFYLMNPVWSGDGETIAAAGLGSYGGKMAVTLDADGSRMYQSIRWIGGLGELVLSPDGTRLAGTLRTAPQETERSGIFVAKATDTDKYRWLVDVTPQGPRLGGARRHGLMSWYTHGSAQPRRVVKTFTSLTFSPDGKTLAFSSDIDPSGAFYVYTIPSDGGEPQRIEGTESAWPQQIMWRPE